jgi:hypothetical protein
VKDSPLDVNIVIRRYRERLAEAHETIVFLESRLEMLELDQLNASVDSVRNVGEDGSTSD